MIHYLSSAALSILAFLLTLVLTPVCRDLFSRLGMLDYPDAARKLHAVPVPRGGGVPIALSYLIAVGVWLRIAPPIPGVPLQWPFLLGVGIILATGLTDDIRGLPAWTKLVAGIAAALAAWWGGVRIPDFHGIGSHGWLSGPLTVLWIVGCANAFNLIDGLDGLAAGLGLFATGTMVIAAVFQHNQPLIFLTIPLAGCLLAFLRYNFAPASIFLGDCGSLFIGFLLGCYGAIWSQKSATMLGMSAPVLAMAVPLLDTGLAVIRRSGARASLFKADREHLHHLLIARGLTQLHAVTLLYIVCCLSAAASLLITVSEQHRIAGLIVLLLCTIGWFGIRDLRGPEPEWNPDLEHRIALRFEEIENNGWFPESLEEASPELAILNETIAPGPGMKILDAGCARGRYSRALVSSGAKLFGVDRTGMFIDSAKVNVPSAHFVHGSVSGLAFADEVFDAVFCLDCLQHLPSTALALSEMARVLRPGGVLVIIDRSLQGLHPGNALPNFLFKAIEERRGRWMYPRHFGYKERWFWPSFLAHQMRTYFNSVEVRYVSEIGGKASKLYKLLPFLAPQSVWIGHK